MRRWVRRAAGAAALVVILDVALSVFDFAPDHVRLALLVALGVAVTGLLSDSVPRVVQRGGSSRWAEAA